MIKLAIIDIIGIPYDGTTVFKQGLGGSESAVSLMAQQLHQQGFSVTVFNNCNMDHAMAGMHDGVLYRPIADLAQDHYFDIIISSRTVIPFVDPQDYQHLQDARAWPFHGMNLYERIVKHAAVRVLWMHDTFCLGDNLIEQLAVDNHITDIFTLSDFHLTYIANCHHGRRRNFEVLKPKLFITRNGAHNYIPEVDITAKDPNLFVYNASVTKGMIPLVNLVWPRVKKLIPQAKLKVVGGYYRFSTASEPDQQEKDWRAMSTDPRYTAMDIEFTGVIPQKAIAELLSKASFTIYPGAFPETFGISTLESLLYNTPVITTRFGALEEIALEGACYLIDYAIEPNVLFTEINSEQQVERFVNLTLRAYNDRYLLQQKQQYCNIIKPLAGWDSIALEWKQHFYRKLGYYLDKADFQQVSKITDRIHTIWNRRYHNKPNLCTYKAGSEQPIAVISTFYNCEQYIEKCITSIATQDYDNYIHILIDDCSTDNTRKVIEHTLSQLPQSIRHKFITVYHDHNRGAVLNQVDAIRHVNNEQAIIMIVDGDDALINDNTVFSYFNKLYDGTTEFTYGSCWSMADSIPLIAQPYPDSVKKQQSYRQHHFNWILPYTHLRTFKKYLINNLTDDQFQDDQGNWYRAGGDGSTFYSLIEAADPNKVRCVQDIVYMYNDRNPLNDYKVNSHEQNTTAHHIISKEPKIKKKILIAIPTNRNIETDTFKSIYDLTVPPNYQTVFQYFYGYSRAQIKNLICQWGKHYDYTIFIRKDYPLDSDTLVNVVNAQSDLVIFDQNIFAVKQHIFEKVNYPHFVSLDTESLELQHFINQAQQHGATVTTIKK
jgi:glycosyltransferase involved in cell wall biosynthesis